MKILPISQKELISMKATLKDGVKSIAWAIATIAITGAVITATLTAGYAFDMLASKIGFKPTLLVGWAALSTLVIVIIFLTKPNSA